jgi:hypothetical protein
MIEFLSTHLLWWHWIVLGIFLLTMEMFTGTFMLLGLGLSAIVVGLIDTLYPISIQAELVIWMILSLLSIIIWFRYIQDQKQDPSGQSNYSLETLGRVEADIPINGRGIVRFDTPILGNSTWQATSKEHLSLGSRVKIITIKGQLIEVASL